MAPNSHNLRIGVAVLVASRVERNAPGASAVDVLAKIIGSAADKIGATCGRGLMAPDAPSSYCRHRPILTRYLTRTGAAARRRRWQRAQKIARHVVGQSSDGSEEGEEQQTGHFLDRATDVRTRSINALGEATFDEESDRGRAVDMRSRTPRYEPRWSASPAAGTSSAGTHTSQRGSPS